MSYKEKPQIKLFRYTQNAFKQIAIIDDYMECSWERNLYEAGQFTISINYNIPNSHLFDKGLFVQFGNDVYDFGLITKIQDNIDQNGKGGQIRNITGFDARYIFKSRVIKNLNSNGNWEMTSKAEYCLRKLIQDQCGITCFEEKRMLPVKNKIGMSNTWTSIVSGVSVQLNEVCFSEDKKIFVAVGNSGTILTSPDGVNWTSRTSGINEGLNRICYAKGPGMFAAVGNNGVILTSPDGINWTSRTSGISSTLHGICYSEKHHLFVAVSSAILTSSDGITWTNRGYASSIKYDVCYSEKLDLFVTIGMSGVLLTSSDGVTWTSGNTGVITQIDRLIYSEEKGLFVGVGNYGTVITSTDGLNWVSRTIGTYELFSVAYSILTNYFVAVGDRGIYTSPDGFSWQKISTVTSRGVSSSLVLGAFVAVGNSGAVYINRNSESSSNIGNEYTVSESFSNLYDVCRTIATQGGIGWRLRFEDGELSLECYEGTDRSTSVQFSPSFDSLRDGSFIDSSENFINSVYVGGKGDNDNRDLYEGESLIDSQSPSGLDRFESFDNQSQLTTEDEYKNQADSILTQYAQSLSMSGNGLASCPYIYKEQYDVGDKIKFSFSNKTANVRILSVTEHWSWNNYEISFSFGKPENRLSEQLQLILRKIQKASNKTNSVESVKWYELPNVNSMPSEDVTYRTIGFTGTIDSDFTFKLFLDNQNTGSKQYNIYIKNLSGTGKLILTSGMENTETVSLNVGDYIGIIYVDNEGNVKNQVIDSLATGNYQPVTSNAVASEVNTINNNVLNLSGDVVNTNSNVKFIPSVSADVSGVFNVTIPGLELEKIVVGTTISIYFTSSIYKTSATTFSLNVNGKQGNIYDGSELWRGCPIRTSATSASVQRYYYVYQRQCLNFRWDGSNWVVINTSPYIKYRYIQSLNSTAVTITSYSFGNWYYVNALSDGSFEQISHFYKFSASGNFLVATKIIPQYWYSYTAHSTALPLTSAGVNTSADYNYTGSQAPTSDDTMSNVTTQGYKQIRYFKSGTSDVAEPTNGRKIHITGTWY